MKKILNIIICIAIILSNFTPFFAYNVSAAEVNYTVEVAYADADVVIGEYENYNDALTKMNEYLSTDKAVAVIKNASGKIINAKYAIAEIDYINGSKNYSDMNSYAAFKYFYDNPKDAGKTNTNLSSYLGYILPTWGADAAFLDYDDTYQAFKVKISGLIGWIDVSDAGLVPISKYYGLTNSSNYPNNQPKLKALATSVTLREGPTTQAAAISNYSSTKGTLYTYYPSQTVTAGGYTWYKVQYNSSTVGYFADNGSWFEDASTFRNHTYFYSKDNVLYHQIHKGTYLSDTNTVLGESPYYYTSDGVKHYSLSLSSGTGTSAGPRYYSFDSNYFYSSLIDMIDDYRNNTYEKAVNASNPYYSYYMYVPSHVKTNIQAGSLDNIISSKGYSAFPTDPKSYVNMSTGAFVKSINGLSMMSGQGINFINAANTYGVSILTLFSSAIQESGTGRSAIAFAKNNLYGMGASDEYPFQNAYTYNSVADSINDYAINIGQSSYGNIYSSVYRGTHYGNKLSGQNVYYASDPYSGESKAGTAYANDYALGLISYNSNTLGITISKTSATKIYAEPSQSSRVIYETKNYYSNKIILNTSFVVTDKINVIENGKVQVYYKVYTDIVLDSSRKLTTDGTILYSFENCYGYIKAEDLYVWNNQPTITVENFNIKQHDSVNLLSYATAYDVEDKNLTSSITIDDTNLDVDTAGTYELTYQVADKSNYAVSKTVTVTVEATDAPNLVFEDIIIPQFKEFDKLTGVSIEDYNNDVSLDDITVSGDINVNEIGEYTLSYIVIDAAGLTDIKTRKVTVIANEKPVIEVNNKTIYIGDTFDELEGVVANDKEDGDVSSTITVTGKVSTSEAGIHTLTYKAVDLDNQVAEKTITVTVEEKKYISKDGMFYLHELKYDSSTKKINFSGYLAVKGIDNKISTDIKYDVIFENQNTGNTIIKKLSRLTKDMPFEVPNLNGYDYSGSWFTEELDLTDIPVGDYTVYVRARLGDYEAKVLLKNEYFNDNVVHKFNIDDTGYLFRINYYNRQLPLELFVRDSGIISSVDNPTIDNMFNQVYSISLNGNILELQASSHNVKGNYASNQIIERTLYFENINTLELAKEVDVGSITNGPYKVNLKVSDGFDKTRVWYKTSVDLNDLPKGTYTLIVRTKTSTIDDYGELYDITFNNDINQSIEVGDKKITIKRNNDLRFRIEITVE